METVNSTRSLSASNVAKFVPKRLNRLARRGGVIRIQKEIYDTIRSVILVRLREIIRRLVILLEGSKYPSRERKELITPDRYDSGYGNSRLRF
ncbi:hypothetical protein GX51_05888 [Blastomyces parvus]|uniref:Histone H4 n=1 Tax=Blastomyces parvus TaxID=2060905 RepID=A0A2B7WLN5_9EURO|nr:hypothetical protein GX51_05888 [Blastomyces parvus]